MTPTQPAIEPFLWTGANSFTPARGALRIAFETVENGPARLDLFNTAGERIVRVFDGAVTGWTLIEAAWDGRNDGGEACSSGVYLLRLSTKRRVLWRRVGLAR